VRGDWSSIAAGPVAAGLLLGLFSALPTGAIAHAVAHASAPAILLAIAGVVPAVGLGAAWLLRGRCRRQAELNLQKHRGALEAVLELADKHKEAVRARVAEEQQQEQDQELEEEAGALRLGRS
jgi:type VI protein secretion system component VasK